MRKLLTVAAIAAVGFVMLPAQAARTIHGMVLVPIPGHAGGSSRCVYGTVGVPTGNATQGSAYFFITGVPAGTRYSLTTDDPVGLNDFDISFYKGLPDRDCTRSAINRTGGGNNDGNEAGVIPALTTTALVYLDTGAAGAFTYKDGL